MSILFAAPKKCLITRQHKKNKKYSKLIGNTITLQEELDSTFGDTITRNRCKSRSSSRTAVVATTKAPAVEQKIKQKTQQKKQQQQQ